jgi:hypothetical protein
MREPGAAVQVRLTWSRKALTIDIQDRANPPVKGII